jgi:hypothetical protein
MSSNDVVPLLQQILQRLTALESKVGSGGGGGGASSSNSSGGGNNDAEAPKSVRAYDEFVSSFVDPFVTAADKLGGDAGSSAHLVKEGFEELRKVLMMAHTCKEPSQAQLPTVLTGISTKAKAANAAVKRNEWEKHCKTVSEGIGCLNW